MGHAQVPEPPGPPSRLSFQLELTRKALADLEFTIDAVTWAIIVPAIVCAGSEGEESAVRAFRQEAMRWEKWSSYYAYKLVGDVALPCGTPPPTDVAKTYYGYINTGAPDDLAPVFYVARRIGSVRAPPEPPTDDPCTICNYAAPRTCETCSARLCGKGCRQVHPCRLGVEEARAFGAHGR